MRLDHIAYRVSSRHKTAQFFIDAFGYSIQESFPIVFDDGSEARCIALEPPEKTLDAVPWKAFVPTLAAVEYQDVEYHLAPEIFVSDGDPTSIVGKWVAARDGIGGIHHMAYQVESVEDTMKEWQQKGYAEFSSAQPMTCPGLTQVFTKPSQLTGVIYEFINRGVRGFCSENVRSLMESTREL
jgi:catechol 2,3-dioxygenase-like lactoylglutathione lyase family enzyme